MSYMFYGCNSLKELNIRNFNTNKVKDTTCMFYKCSSLKHYIFLNLMPIIYQICLSCSFVVHH